MFDESPLMFNVALLVSRARVNPGRTRSIVVVFESDNLLKQAH